MPAELPTPCEYARARHQELLTWRNLWTILLFVFGASLVVFLVGAILLFINEAWISASLSTLSSIVNGVAITWVRSRRVEAVEEEEKAYQDVGAKCGRTKEADAVRAKMRLFGDVF